MVPIEHYFCDLALSQEVRFNDEMPTIKSNSTTKTVRTIPGNSEKQPRRSKKPRQLELLEVFAVEHNLELSTWKGDSGMDKVPVIKLGDYGGAHINGTIPGCSIQDPYDDYVEGMLGSIVDGQGNWIDRREDAKLLKDARDRQLLIFTIFTGATNVLYDRVGFDVFHYDNGGGDPSDPNSSKWGKKLHKLDINYLIGDDTAVCFTFPARDPEAVKMILNLAEKSIVVDGTKTSAIACE